MADDDRKPLTFEQAREALDVQDGHVHVFASVYDGVNVTLVGSEWSVAKVEAAIRDLGAEIAGPFALGMKHGVCVRAAERFFATRKGWTGP